MERNQSRSGNRGHQGQQGNREGRQNTTEEFDSGTSSYFIEALNDEIQVTEDRLNHLRHLQGSYDQNSSPSFSNSNRGGMTGGRQNRDNSSNYDRSSSSRNRHFANSGDVSDDRTLAGRSNDDQEFDENTLNDFLKNPEDRIMNQDGSFDLRTKEGRALQAAGYVDEDGFIIEEAIPAGRGGQVHGRRGTMSGSR